MKTDRNTAAAIGMAARECGYEDCGFLGLDAFAGYLEELEKRIHAFPASAALYEPLKRFAYPARDDPWARSVLVCVRRYGRFRIPAGLDRYFGRYYLFETGLPYSKHAAMHAAFEEELSALGVRAKRTETAARRAAVRAGLGWIGCNNLFYTEAGSWVNIDTWLLDRKMESDRGEAPSKCNGCRKCIAACPTGALSSPHMIDMARCVTWINVNSHAPGAGCASDFVYGCDICQKVCPLNRGRWSEDADFPGMEEFASMFSLERLFEENSRPFREMLLGKFGFIGPDDGWKWRVNALRSMSHGDAGRSLSFVRRAAHDSDERVRSAGRWLLESMTEAKGDAE